MKLKLRVFEVPLHPLLVHFPIAFWLVVPMLDIAALYAGPDPWWTMAQAATILGIVIGAASIAVACGSCRTSRALATRGEVIIEKARSW